MNTFRSKVDGWLGTLLVGAIAFEIIMAIYIYSLGIPNKAAIVAVLLASSGLILWILLGTVYRLDESMLLVRSGPFCTRIPLSQITSIEPTRSALSSPALSLDRLRLKFGKGRSCMISPQLQPEFLGEIRRRCVNLKG